MATTDECKKILFIVPPYFEDFSVEIEIAVPTNLLMLGGIAKQEGWKPLYLDMALEIKDEVNPYNLLNKILKDKSIKLVGISNHTVRTSITTGKVSTLIKKLRSDLRIIVGGVNSTFMYNELMNWHPSIDYIILGYAQASLRLFLNKINKHSDYTLEDIPNLVYRHNGSVICNPQADFSTDDFDVDNLNDLKINRYTSWTTTYPLLTHTGCLFSCKFCTSVFPGPYSNLEKYRSIPSILSEMELAIDKGFDSFFVSSNIFTSNIEWSKKLLNQMISKNIPEKATWVCMSRVEFINEELIQLLKKAGCINIAFGLEVADKKIWKNLKKGVYNEQSVISSFKSCSKNELDTTVFLIIGLPEQNMNNIKYTQELLLSLNASDLVISYFQPFPGTPYWDNYDEFGLSDIAELKDWNYHEMPVCSTKHFSKDELFFLGLNLYLNHANKKEIDLNKNLVIHENYIHESHSVYNDCVLYGIEQINARKTIKDVFLNVEKKYNKRGCLILTYWLIYYIKNGLINQE